MAEFVLRQLDALIGRPFRRQVHVQQSEFGILLAITAVHCPQRPTLATAVFHTSLGVTIALLNRSGHGEPRGTMQGL